MQDRVVRTGRDHLREHPPRPEDVAVRHQPLHGIEEGRVRPPVAKGTRYGLLQVGVEDAAPHQGGDGQGRVQGLKG